MRADIVLIECTTTAGPLSLHRRNTFKGIHYVVDAIVRWEPSEQFHPTVWASMGQ